MIIINSKELRKALKNIEEAEKNGFMYCESVFKPKGVDDAFVIHKYSDIIEKAHPTNGKLNWGRFQNVTKENKFIDGKLVPIKETL